VNMQTSFMHPPFGFALFYLRSVAPKEDYVDEATGKRMAKVKTSDIYWGAVPFVLIQIVMVALIIAFPHLVRVQQSNAVADTPLNLEVPEQHYEAPTAAPEFNLSSEPDKH